MKENAPGGCGCCGCDIREYTLYPDFYFPSEVRCYVRERVVTVTTVGDASPTTTDVTTETTDTKMIAGRWAWDYPETSTTDDQGVVTTVKVDIYEERRLAMQFDVSNQHMFGELNDDNIDMIVSSHIRVAVLRYRREDFAGTLPQSHSATMYGFYINESIPTDIAAFDALRGTAPNTKSLTSSVGETANSVRFDITSVKPWLPTESKDTLTILFDSETSSRGTLIAEVKIAIADRAYTLYEASGIAQEYDWQKDWTRTTTVDSITWKLKKTVPLIDSRQVLLMAEESTDWSAKWTDDKGNDVLAIEAEYIEDPVIPDWMPAHDPTKTQDYRQHSGIAGASYPVYRDATKITLSGLGVDSMFYFADAASERNSGVSNGFIIHVWDDSITFERIGKEYDRHLYWLQGDLRLFVLNDKFRSNVRGVDGTTPFVSNNTWGNHFINANDLIPHSEISEVGLTAGPIAFSAEAYKEWACHYAPTFTVDRTISGIEKKCRFEFTVPRKKRASEYRVASTEPLESEDQDRDPYDPALKGSKKPGSCPTPLRVSELIKTEQRPRLVADIEFGEYTGTTALIAYHPVLASSIVGFDETYPYKLPIEQLRGSVGWEGDGEPWGSSGSTSRANYTLSVKGEIASSRYEQTVFVTNGSNIYSEIIEELSGLELASVNVVELLNGDATVTKSLSAAVEVAVDITKEIIQDVETMVANVKATVLYNDMRPVYSNPTQQHVYDDTATGNLVYSKHISRDYFPYGSSVVKNGTAFTVYATNPCGTGSLIEHASWTPSPLVDHVPFRYQKVATDLNWRVPLQSMQYDSIEEIEEIVLLGSNSDEDPGDFDGVRRVTDIIDADFSEIAYSSTQKALVCVTAFNTGDQQVSMSLSGRLRLHLETIDSFLKDLKITIRQ